MKILWYGDFLVPTGFGNVAEEIISRLQPDHEFTVLAVNHFGDPYNQGPYARFRNIPVYPAKEGDDYLGRQKLLNLLNKKDFDVLFILQDMFNLVPLQEQLLVAKEGKKFKLVLYFPVDADLNPEWMRFLHLTNYAATYTEYGRGKVAECCSYPVSVIPHGVDTKVFFPLTPPEKMMYRAQYMWAGLNDFVITNVNRNQHRKDLPRTILTFIKIKELIPTAKLYLHTEVSNPMGNDLNAFIKRYVPRGMWTSIILPTPEAMSGSGLPKEIMRRIYGCSDVVISTSRGEGWGLSCTESMACRVPVVMPRHTSLEEIVGEDRGSLVACDGVDVNPFDNDRIRPVVSIDDLVKKVCYVHEQPEQSLARAELALAWVKENCDWDKIAAQWGEVFKGL